MSCKPINLGNRMTVIMCGHRDHKCNEEYVVYTDDKGVEYWNHPDFQQLQREHNIVSGSVACSICHRPSIMGIYLY